MLAERSKIDPTLIQGFWEDFTPLQLTRLAAALRSVPGAEKGFDALWEKFQRNQAVTLFCRNEAGEMAGLSFYEVRIKPPSSAREFFVSGGIALQPSQTLVEDTLPQFEKFARFLNCQTVSFRTGRAGLVQKAQRLGWELSPILDEGEFVLRQRIGEVIL